MRDQLNNLAEKSPGAGNPSLSYKASGVDIDAGEAAIRRIKKLAKDTHGPQVLSGLGGFGGLYQFPTDRYHQPVLVSSTDGVGTKLKLAFLTGRHDTVGQDLVNHCVNDILTTGAEPLYFLDYYATDHLEGDIFEQVVEGLSTACHANGCALIGGETAEMPDFYQAGEYDISGTIVGVVEKEAILTGASIEAGDLLIGLPSNGLHTNGYSLARKALLREWSVDTYVSELGGTVGEAMLAIHRSYLRVMQPLLKQPWLRGMAHITGGGLEGNTSRLLSSDLRLAIDWEAWEWPAIFRVIQQAGGVDEEDMKRTFNLGIGWVLVIDREYLPDLDQYLSDMDEERILVGMIQ
ncbi:phosphoribosylformylglycinamidine cyclo-ligase [Candidatus Neomarinimicrobiota bacterium]